MHDERRDWRQSRVNRKRRRFPRRQPRSRKSGLVRAALRRAVVVGGPEAGAAATGRDRVRVVDREPGAHERVDVVDLRALEQGDALAVDVDLDAVRVEDLVLGASGRPRASSRSGSRSSRRSRRRPAARSAGFVSSLVSSRSFDAAASVRETTVGWISDIGAILLRRVALFVEVCRTRVDRSMAHRTRATGFRQALRRNRPAYDSAGASYPSIRSTTVAIPWPTPMHIVARP